MATLKPLCTTCERTFATNDDTTSHHTAAEELVQSVETGCFICKRLYNIIQEMKHNAHSRGGSNMERPLFDEIRYSRPWSKDGWLARRFTIKAFDGYQEILFDCISKEGGPCQLFPSTDTRSHRRAKYAESLTSHQAIRTSNLSRPFIEITKRFEASKGMARELSTAP